VTNKQVTLKFPTSFHRVSYRTPCGIYLTSSLLKWEFFFQFSTYFTFLKHWQNTSKLVIMNSYKSSAW